MAFAKRATVFLVDAGRTMAQPLEPGGPPNLSMALEAVRLCVGQKLATQPKHELGLLLFGTAEDNSRCVLGEEGGQLCQALVDRDGLIDAPDVEMLSRVDALGGPKASEEPADAVGALALALTMLERRCEKRKHEKTIYLYTDSGTPFNEADLEDTGSEADLNLSSVVRKLAADRACLKVVGLGFAGSAAAGPDPAAPAGPAGPAGPEAE